METDMNPETLRTFLGYCTLINFALLIFSSVSLLLLQEKISAMHARFFHIDQEAVRTLYFRFLANYKTLIIVFNLVPWIALHLI